MDTQLQQEIIAALPYFHGSEQLFEHKTLFGRLHLTEGAAYIREKAQCRWLYDLIQSYQRGSMKLQDFQNWTLEKVSDIAFLVTCTDGNKNVLARQKIEFSDFPLGSYTVWLVNGVCLLPSEY